MADGDVEGAARRLSHTSAPIPVGIGDESGVLLTRGVDPPVEPLDRQWRLAAHPEGLIKPGDFRWHEEPLAPLRDGEVLVRVEYLSLDPTNRIWANGQESYLPPVALGWPGNWPLG